MFILTLDFFRKNENERSFSGEYLLATALAPDSTGKMLQRRELILEAAEHVFLKKGFEGATMQDVAAAASMSPGNIYRYFPAKASIIAGLVERDRADMNAKFALLATMPNKLEAFEMLGRAYFTQEACPKSPLTLEIWASASRDAEIQTVVQTIEDSVVDNIMSLLISASDNGEIGEGIDLTLICDLIMLLADGIMRYSAVSTNQQLEHQLDVMFATLRAAYAGHISLAPPQPRSLA
jgi:TetR/AcrR family transcriptional regulator, repressor for uid operon